MKMVLVDTKIWSAFLRRKSVDDNALKKKISDLIKTNTLKMIGPIRQEILAGIRDAEKFELLRSNLEPFKDEPILTGDYEHAARIQNLCASKGIACSSICTMTVFT